jgi:hypothetical protein
MEMGVGGARHRALGILAVSSGPVVLPATVIDAIMNRSVAMNRPGVAALVGVHNLRGAVALCVAVVALSGCSSLGGFTGAAAGIATGAATSNPAVGIGVGVAVQAATDYAVQTVFRTMQHSEQDLIANAAGNLAIGEKRSWAVHHTLSFGDEHGELQVIGEIHNALAQCKEVGFSVIGGKKDAPTSQWFITQVCRSEGKWQWAAAEPAVERWGTLQ